MMKKIITAIACCFLLNTMAISQQLKISNGAYFTAKDVFVTISNTDVVNDGTITGTNNRFIFSGANNTSLSGLGITNFNTVEIAKQNNAKLVLLKNITASGHVVFTSGIIDIGNQKFELLYPGGLLQNEKETSRILTNGTGEVLITQTLNAPNNINPGNLGATISSNQNLGITTVRRGHQIQTNNAQQQSIQRYFQIDPTNNSNLNAGFRFQYFDAELNNQLEAGLVIFKKEGATNWVKVGKDASDINTNFIEKNSFASLQRFSLFSSVAAPLPLTLIAFDAKCKDGSVALQWITANEVNTKQFTIEKSNDGNNWQAAEIISAKGNSSQYTYSSTISPGDASLVRLKMEDADGKFTYSPVRKIDCSNANKIVVGPNPTKGDLTISATVNQSSVLNITVVDMNGRTILSKPWKLKAGLNSNKIDLYSHASSAYLVIIKGEGINETVKIVKQ